MSGRGSGISRLKEGGSLLLASSVLGSEVLDGTVRTLLLLLDSSEGLLVGGLDVSASLEGDSAHLVGVGGDVLVGLLESISGLVTESLLCSSISSDSTLDLDSDLLSVGG